MSTVTEELDEHRLRELQHLLAQAAAAARAVAAEIERVDASTVDADAWQESGARVGELMTQFRRSLGDINRTFGLGGGRERVLRFMLRHVGDEVTGAQLSGVAGIHEWARRIRELRVEDGWPVDAVRVEQEGHAYVLTATEPDADLAQQWRLANRLRNAPGTAKQRGLKYLKELSPRPANQAQLFYVMKINSWQRRIRELDEEGWEIRSNIDEPELRPGTYRLASLERRPPRQRQAIKLRWSILERDRFTCQDCGAQRGDVGVRLQVHHMQEVSRGGSNDPENLRTLCSNCHAGRHAVDPGTTSDELLAPTA